MAVDIPVTHVVMANAVIVASWTDSVSALATELYRSVLESQEASYRLDAFGELVT